MQDIFKNMISLTISSNILVPPPQVNKSQYMDTILEMYLICNGENHLSRCYFIFLKGEKYIMQVRVYK